MPWASKRPLLSVIRPSAVPTRRPRVSTTPSAVIRPVSAVIGRTSEISNSRVVWPTFVAVVAVMLMPPGTPAVWTSAILRPADLAIALIAWALLDRLRLPPVLVVLFCVIASVGASLAGLG